MFLKNFQDNIWGNIKKILIFTNILKNVTLLSKDCRFNKTTTESRDKRKNIKGSFFAACLCLVILLINKAFHFRGV